MVPELLKSFGRAIFRWNDLDLRSVKSRLRDLNARDMDLSAVLSTNDAPGAPDEFLIDLLPPVIRRAKTISLTLLRERHAPPFVHVWPGEHYRLLAALTDELNPRHVVEIGTCQGFSALAVLPHLAPEARLTTFDLYPWDRFPGTLLRTEDFAGQRLQQVVADLGDAAVAEQHGAFLRSADLVFVDAAKDGYLEQRILDNFQRVGLRDGTLVVLDDVRLWNMLRIWRNIRSPKLDAGTIGHYTGTGLVSWRNELPGEVP